MIDIRQGYVRWRAHLSGARLRKGPPIGVRLPKGVKAALEKLAKAEDRTIGNLVNRICAEYLRARKLIK
jgi:hypothetical protein